MFRQTRQTSQRSHGPESVFRKVTFHGYPSCSSLISKLARPKCRLYRIDPKYSILLRYLTRTSADADKPARRVWRSVKVIKHSRPTIPYVRYSFLLCNSNFVLRRAVITIFVFKKFHDLEMGVKDHSRSSRVISFDRLCMVSY